MTNYLVEFEAVKVYSFEWSLNKAKVKRCPKHRIQESAVVRLWQRFKAGCGGLGKLSSRGEGKELLLFFEFLSLCLICWFFIFFEKRNISWHAPSPGPGPRQPASPKRLLFFFSFFERWIRGRVPKEQRTTTLFCQSQGWDLWSDELGWRQTSNLARFWTRRSK